MKRLNSIVFESPCDSLLTERSSAALRVTDLLETYGSRVDEFFNGKDFPNKPIIKFRGNWGGIPSEYSLRRFCRVEESFKRKRCGIQASSPIHTAGILEFDTVHRGLLLLGMNLCWNKNQLHIFLKKYVAPYNARQWGNGVTYANLRIFSPALVRET